MKIVAIGGVPGTGKTVLMKRCIRKLGPFKSKKIGTIECLLNSKKKLLILGRYDDADGYAQGTDMLSMSVQPEAEELVEDGKYHILFEGDRLFNVKFLVHCKKHADLNIFVLSAPEDLLAERYAKRGSTQSETFRRSRYSKVAKARANAALAKHIQLVNHVDREDMKEAFQLIDDSFFNGYLVEETWKEVRKKTGIGKFL